MADLFMSVPPPPGATPIGDRYSMTKEGDIVVVFLGGAPVASFECSDTTARDLVIVQLCEHGGVAEREAADAFGISRPTVSRAKSKYREGGALALMPRKRGPRGASKLKGERRRTMVRLAREGCSNAEIARRLGLDEATIRRALQREPFRKQAATQLELQTPDAPEMADEEAPSTIDQPAPRLVQDEDATPPAAMAPSSGDVSGLGTAPQSVEHILDTDQAASEPGANEGSILQQATGTEVPAVETFDRDPDNRTLDRISARLGLLSDAAPLFGKREKVKQAGLLLALPILANHHVFKDAMDVFAGIGPAFYGLRNTIVALLFMFLSRIGRPEGLKEHSPQDLGAVMGLDRYPEMKTLRRKIKTLAAQGRSLKFMERLTERHLKRIPGAHLWLYLDGHVSVYSGKGKLKKHHVTRLRMSLPSVLDYWINDDRGDPLMVITAPPKKGMKMLPKLIDGLREHGETRPITIAFDREGWSPQVFAQIDAMEGVYFLTYRKAKANKRLPRLAQTRFATYEEKVHGKVVEYQLADGGIYINYGPAQKRKRLHLRQVTRLCENGHQTHIVTNDWGATTFELAHRMFSRWGQENYFKYMSDEMALDGLYTYDMEDGDPERLVPNPKRKKLTLKLKRIEKERDQLAAAYGERALSNEEKQRKTMRGFKIANGALAKEIREFESKIDVLKQKITSLPAKVPVTKTLNGDDPKQVHVETRRLIHCFRIAAYRAESALRELLRPNYRRWRQDGRTIVQSMLQSSGDIEATESELRVVLDAQSAPHRTRALAALCDELNTLDAKFPGSSLTMRFSVREPENVS